MTVYTEQEDFTGYRTAGASDRDRYTAERQAILEQSLEAWRVNPLARRIVGLTSQYVVGGGLEFACKHVHTSKFVRDFWDHRLNRMGTRIYEWCDELTRSGNLFILLTTDSSGMSYVRTIPAYDVQEIISAHNDIEQELAFDVIPSHGNNGELQNESFQVVRYPAYREGVLYEPLVEDLSPSSAGGQPVILHYAINRPTGGQWGEPDLAPILRWLSRYANWLEDRARLNRYVILSSSSSRASISIPPRKPPARLPSTPPARPGSAWSPMILKPGRCSTPPAELRCQ